MKIRIFVAALTVSAAALVGIAQREDYTSHAVIPVPGDVPTIGYGTTVGVRMGDTIAPPRALVRLLEDADRHAAAVRRCAPVPMYQREFDAWVSFTYNVGAGAFCASTAARKLNAGDYSGACAEMKRWTRVKGREVRGLVNRREDEYRQCMGLT